MNKLKFILSIFMGLLLIVTCQLQIISVADCGNDEPYDIAFINIYPDTLVKGETMTIKVQFTNNTFINSTLLNVYQKDNLAYEVLEENIPMIGGHTSIRCPGTERFDGNYTVKEDIGARIVFTIQIIYDNLSSVTLPKSPQFLDMEIEDLGCFMYCFTAGIVGGTTTKTSFSLLFPAVLLIWTTVVFYKKRFR